MSAWRVTSAPTSPGTCCSPTASRLRGVALPCAMAAAMVRPRTHILSVSGDGGFLFSAQELETATRLGPRLTHVITRDDTYDMVGFQELLKSGRKPGVQHRPVPPVALRRA
ncbi:MULTISPECIES: thiamine pyrophosphate-dependent enzyme [unclassified Streptomyces]|uniref:thiamine pyrophosphate-dependent enzyme n=1 Tax=unclassified Streptomyces TaxID=2593676 RepID=UPI0021C9A188|nr:MULTISPECIES: thiamine pyrophosphate-dependent enzyme [unclassified Streptomyces]